MPQWTTPSLPCALRYDGLPDQDGGHTRCGVLACDVAHIPLKFSPRGRDHGLWQPVLGTKKGPNRADACGRVRTRADACGADFQRETEGRAVFQSGPIYPLHGFDSRGLQRIAYGSFCFVFSTGTNRSPTASRRLCSVLMLKRLGSSRRVTSLHLSGAENEAASTARSV